MKTTFQASNGQYVCAEGGGGNGQELVANRNSVGPWEEFEVEPRDNDLFAFKTSDGFYLGVEPTTAVPTIDRTRVGEWEEWRVVKGETDGTIALRNEYTGLFLTAVGGGGSRMMVNAAEVHAWECLVPSEEFWKTKDKVCRRPLIGPLRVQDKIFHDDTGPRRVHFCSWFPALRILRDNPTEFYRQLDSITANGYQGIRVFLAVGGWDDYWNGREVAPITFTKWFWTGSHMRTDAYSYTVEAWPEYDDLLRTLLRECVKRKLRLHVTTGDMQIICPDPDEELELIRRLARICAEEGGLEVIAVAETTNEYPLNRYGSNEDISIHQMGEVIDVWRDEIPGVCTMQGANPQNEEPDSLERASTYGNVCAVHVVRSPQEVCLKHTLGLVYWEGDYRAFKFPFWEGEPAGPGEDSFDRQDDPAFLTALYAMMALTGQASNWFQGAAVRSHEPLESEWGFVELPPILDLIPEDIATWDHASNQHGGIEYWFKGNDFFTVSLAGWDPSPPRPIASWTLYTGTSVHSGVGNPHQGTKTLKGAAAGTGLAIGKFA